LKNAFKKVNQEVEIIASDSGQEARTENGYLPRGTLNILIGQLAGLRVKDKDKYDELGRWSSFQLEGNNKMVQVINLYRIPDSTTPGILKSKAQYDRATGITKTVRQYQKEILVTIKKVIDDARNKKVDYILVVGDLNQDVEDPRIA